MSIICRGLPFENQVCKFGVASCDHRVRPVPHISRLVVRSAKTLDRHSRAKLDAATTTTLLLLLVSTA